MKSKPSQPVIALIGAKGKMAGEFAKLLKKDGITVLEVDRDTKLTLEKAAITADIIIISVPISHTASVVKKALIAARPGTLVTDFTSIKMQVEEEFQKSGRTDIEMVGLHPMFGPSMISDMKSQVIAYCPMRAGKWAAWLVAFLKRQGALVKKTTAQKHDECMAIIQGITHFSAIASGMALKKLGVNIADTRAFASPIYSLRLAMIGRILSQSPELYADIEIENASTTKAVHAYQEAINELSKVITSKDKKAFIKAFNGASAFLGDYTQTAQTETDRLIKLMRKNADK